MTAREIALAHARGRMAVGLGLVLAPGLAGSLWIGNEARRPAAQVFARALGVRDLALGMGVLVAIHRGAPVRGWLEAGALADVVDLAATMMAGPAIPESARRAVAVVAGSSALVSAALARALDEDPKPRVGEHAPDFAPGPTPNSPADAAVY